VHRVINGTPRRPLISWGSAGAWFVRRDVGRGWRGGRCRRWQRRLERVRRAAEFLLCMRVPRWHGVSQSAASPGNAVGVLRTDRPAQRTAGRPPRAHGRAGGVRRESGRAADASGRGPTRPPPRMRRRRMASDAVRAHPRRGVNKRGVRAPTGPAIAARAWGNRPVHGVINSAPRRTRSICSAILAFLVFHRRSVGTADDRARRRHRRRGRKAKNRRPRGARTARGRQNRTKRDRRGRPMLVREDVLAAVSALERSATGRTAAAEDAREPRSSEPGGQRPRGQGHGPRRDRGP
jgi:hypothetical protein